MDEDGDEAVRRLTEAQKECLRLVMRGYKSKEIAHRLGIGVDAVNKRLSAAMGTLQVSSRSIAARRLAAFEEVGGYHSLVGQTLAVEQPPIGEDPEGIADPDESLHEPHTRFRLEEPQAPYGDLAPTRSSPPPFRRSSPLGRLLTPARIFLLALGGGALLEIATRA